jgi:hypothetical protein
MTTRWIHGRNRCQEYYHPAGSHKIQVVRNLTERHWVIYDLRGGSPRMVPNPYPAHAQLRFREITALPACGERFGSRPEHDCIGPPSPNFAWDTAQSAKRRVEETLLNVPPAA